MQLFGRWQVQLILLLSLCCPVSIFAQDADTPASTTEAASDATPAETPAVTEPEFDTLVKALTQGSLPKRAQTAKKLGKLEDHRVAGIIAALQQGNLYA
jgi:urea transport system permease protein